MVYEQLQVKVLSDGLSSFSFNLQQAVSSDVYVFGTEQFAICPLCDRTLRHFLKRLCVSFCITVVFLSCAPANCLRSPSSHIAQSLFVHVQVNLASTKVRPAHRTQLQSKKNGRRWTKGYVFLLVPSIPPSALIAFLRMMQWADFLSLSVTISEKARFLFLSLMPFCLMFKLCHNENFG